jgi:hypothetical protein
MGGLNSGPHRSARLHEDRAKRFDVLDLQGRAKAELWPDGTRYTVAFAAPHHRREVYRCGRWQQPVSNSARLSLIRGPTFDPWNLITARELAALEAAIISHSDAPHLSVLGCSLRQAPLLLWRMGSEIDAGARPCAEMITHPHARRLAISGST